MEFLHGFLQVFKVWPISCPCSEFFWFAHETRHNTVWSQLFLFLPHPVKNGAKKILAFCLENVKCGVLFLFFCQSYDDLKRDEAQLENDARRVAAYSSESEDATAHLNDLKDRVKNVEDQVGSWENSTGYFVLRISPFTHARVFLFCLSGSVGSHGVQKPCWGKGEFFVMTFSLCIYSKFLLWQDTKHTHTHSPNIDMSYTACRVPNWYLMHWIITWRDWWRTSAAKRRALRRKHKLIMMRLSKVEWACTLEGTSFLKQLMSTLHPTIQASLSDGQFLVSRTTNTSCVSLVAHATVLKVFLRDCRPNLSPRHWRSWKWKVCIAGKLDTPKKRRYESSPVVPLCRLRGRNLPWDPQLFLCQFWKLLSFSSLRTRDFTSCVFYRCQRCCCQSPITTWKSLADSSANFKTQRTPRKTEIAVQRCARHGPSRIDVGIFWEVAAKVRPLSWDCHCCGRSGKTLRKRCVKSGKRVKSLLSWLCWRHVNCRKVWFKVSPRKCCLILCTFAGGPALSVDRICKITYHAVCTAHLLCFFPFFQAPQDAGPNQCHLGTFVAP